MAAERLPDTVREFTDYLRDLLARLDRYGGWCLVFWQRDPEGMRACLEGREPPPWDVLESLLHDLAVAYGTGAAEAETPRARALHASAVEAYDARPGAREALSDRLDVMLREQRYAAERRTALVRRLADAATAEEAEALGADLAWAEDDHARATARCAEINARMSARHRRSRPTAGAAPSDTPRPAGPTPAPAPAIVPEWNHSPTGHGSASAGPAAPDSGRDAAGGSSAAAPGAGSADGRNAPAPGPADAAASGSEFGYGASARGRDAGEGVPWEAARAGGVDGRDLHGLGPAGAATTGRPVPGAEFGHGASAPGRDAAEGYSAAAPWAGGAAGRDLHAPGQAGVAENGRGGAPGPGVDVGSGDFGAPGPVAGVGGVGGGRAVSVSGSGSAFESGGGWHDGLGRGGGESETVRAGDVEDRDFGASGPAGVAGNGPAVPGPGPGYEAGGRGTPAAEADTGRAAGGKGRKRRRGGARFAGVAEGEAVVVPPAAVPSLPVTPAGARGARFAGGGERAPVEEPRPEPRVGPADRREAARTVAALARLRREERGGEAHALLTETAYAPAARFPLLADEMRRAGLGADWATLLWEAAAALPTDRLVAVAGALAAAGHDEDAERILRQGVVRPADEIGRAVLALTAETRHAEARALLDACVRTRPPEDAARTAAPDPYRLVPLLLTAARGVSDGRHRDLLHALRVAGLAA